MCSMAGRHKRVGGDATREESDPQTLLWASFAARSDARPPATRPRSESPIHQSKTRLRPKKNTQAQ